MISIRVPHMIFRKLHVGYCETVKIILHPTSGKVETNGRWYESLEVAWNLQGKSVLPHIASPTCYLILIHTVLSFASSIYINQSIMIVGNSLPTLTFCVS